jgi:hypothetical protein
MTKKEEICQEWLGDPHFPSEIVFFCMNEYAKYASEKAWEYAKRRYAGFGDRGDFPCDIKGWWNKFKENEQ